MCSVQSGHDPFLFRRRFFGKKDSGRGMIVCYLLRDFGSFSVKKERPRPKVL